MEKNILMRKICLEEFHVSIMRKRRSG